jgi:hypothetical protein
MQPRSSSRTLADRDHQSLPRPRLGETSCQTDSNDPAPSTCRSMTSALGQHGKCHRVLALFPLVRTTSLLRSARDGPCVEYHLSEVGGHGFLKCTHRSTSYGLGGSPPDMCGQRHFCEAAVRAGSVNEPCAGARVRDDPGPLDGVRYSAVRHLLEPTSSRIYHKRPDVSGSL